MSNQFINIEVTLGLFFVRSVPGFIPFEHTEILNVQRKFEQDVRDRVLRLVEDRSWAERRVNARLMSGSSPEAGGLMAYSPAMD
ncbi:hypothetical protein QP960_003620 [Corynebacterium rhinophilum]|uniref:hypothetical protein n=1 Tax=Corynebacterium rhinophilum TaxID=3050197 RepID=UPI00254FB2F0|nr:MULTISPECIES: hypothetical protein [unclassified Corynebacterium]MDK8453480.1 hypothetical protein [Corynebacterium sp. MSK084]MDK8515410.1 hypothetical protein [Corynebacterium sp. MSK123]MDK8548587.1 hypothetical protein [Corynebacterium sp. MSK222]